VFDISVKNGKAYSSGLCEMGIVQSHYIDYVERPHIAQQVDPSVAW